jgi:Vitamin B12 dependent methionine synthase, activation domain
VREDRDDYVALFAVTCGGGVRERAASDKERGDYLRSHALQALAIESAEALAEWLHARLRTLWGFPDPSELSIADKLKAHYRGIRVSFGYPACPELADQATLWRLLRPEEIGVALTDGSRGVGLGARLPPPRRQVLQGLGLSGAPLRRGALSGGTPRSPAGPGSDAARSPRDGTPRTSPSTAAAAPASGR